MNPIQRVIDETGAFHQLVRTLGKPGGQGCVYLTEGGRRIVKLMHPHIDRETIRRQLSFVRRLDLSGLHVAKPIAVLKPPHVGYVAEFLGNMVPIKALMEAPTSGLLRWHIDTGGLRRRLRLLAHAGEAIAGLHTRGVVYADLSDNNVFVSEPVHAVEAWLIDLDNLSHESDPRRAIHTPGYGAPEVVGGVAGCTSLSDAWAFAVLVWQVLTLTKHPFVGDLVDDGEPGMEVEAHAGRIPWVRDSRDERNSCSKGLPPERVLAGRLIDLARRTFEDGLNDRKARPGVLEWVERLHAAADQTVTCAGCGGTFFVPEPACPWCDEPRPSVGTVRIARWHPGKGIVEGAVRLGQLPLTREGLLLPRRITQGLSGLSARESQVEIMPVERGVSVRAMPGFDAWVAPMVKTTEERHSVSGRGRIVPPNGWMVFFEDPALPQRVALLGRSA